MTIIPGDEGISIRNINIITGNLNELILKADFLFPHYYCCYRHLSSKTWKVLTFDNSYYTIVGFFDREFQMRGTRFQFFLEIPDFRGKTRQNAENKQKFDFFINQHILCLIRSPVKSSSSRGHHKSSSSKPSRSSDHHRDRDRDKRKREHSSSSSKHKSHHQSSKKSKR